MNDSQNINNSQHGGKEPKTSCIIADNSDFLALVNEVPQYTPLNRSDFDMGILNRWCEIRAKHPPQRRSFHSSFQYKNYLFVFGGVDILEGKLNDIKAINLLDDVPHWEDVTTTGEEIEKLAYHAGAEVNGMYFIIGGENSAMEPTNSVYVFDIDNRKIELLKFKETDFPCMEGHTACQYGEDIIIFGGFAKGVRMNDLYSFNATTKTFRNLTKTIDPKNRPIGRSNHAAVILKDELFVFGGEAQDGVYLNDLWKIDLKALSKWEEPDPNIKNLANDPSYYPKPRSGHAMVIYKDIFYILGGKTNNIHETNELWRYDPMRNQFDLLHDTLLMQYTERELEEQKPKNEDNTKKKKKFTLLSKREIEVRHNPMSKSYRNPQSKMTKEMMIKTHPMMEFKQKIEGEIVKNPVVSKMKKSTIFNLDEKDILSVMGRLNTMLSLKPMVGPEEVSLPSTLPMPRDGHTAVVYNQLIVTFGGDRNKFPFNDMHLFSL